MFPLNTLASSNIADLLFKKAELVALLKKNEEDLNVDRPVFIAQVHQLIKAFTITKEEAFPPNKKEPKAPVHKYFSSDYFYRDHKTGEEWDGMGKKRPAFLLNKRNTEEFRIYHATGTKLPPVVKHIVAQPVATSSGVTVPPEVAMPVTESPNVASVGHHQPVAVADPIAADQSVSALQASAVVEAAPIPS
jgi:hypothetical protein